MAHSLAIHQSGTCVVRGGAFYRDRTLRAKDRKPAGAVLDEARMGHQLRRRGWSCVYSGRTWRKPRGALLIASGWGVVEAANLENHCVRDCNVAMCAMSRSPT